MTRVVVGIIKIYDEFGKDQYLLIQSKKYFEQYTGYWYPPGAHVENNETDEETLIREFKKDLNLKIKPVKIITENPSDIKDQITAWWECETDKTDEKFKIDTSELNDAEYFTYDQMKAIHIWPATKNFFENFIFGKKIES